MRIEVCIKIVCVCGQKSGVGGNVERFIVGEFEFYLDCFAASDFVLLMGTSPGVVKISTPSSFPSSVSFSSSFHTTPMLCGRGKMSRDFFCLVSTTLLSVSVMVWVM